MDHTNPHAPSHDTPSTLGARWLVFALVAGLAAGCGDDDAPPRESAAFEPAIAPSAPRPATDEPAEPTHLGTIAPSNAPTSPIATPPSRPEPAEGADADPVDGLDVRRVALARSVEDREPVDPATSFVAEDAPLYAHFELTNREGTEARHPVVVFVGPDGQDRGLIELSVPAGAPRWRTWAFSRNVRLPGDWRVELRDEDARVLTDHEFSIEAADGVGAEE